MSFQEISPKLSAKEYTDRRAKWQTYLASIMAGKNTISVTESSVIKEKVTTSFEQVVFGHRYRDFDLDQMLTYYFALKGGLIAPQTPIQFSASPNLDQLQSNKIMVIEGFDPKKTDQRPPSKTGNFTNGEQDKAAATILFDSFPHRFTQPELRDLNTWFKIVESGIPAAKKGNLAKEIATLPRESLDLITKLFYALKERHRHTKNQRILVERSIQMLDLVLNGASEEDLKLMYQPQLRLAEQKNQEDEQSLEERSRNPQALQTVTALTGLKLACFDIRGLETESGAFGVASKHTGADIIMLVDHEYDDDDNIIGTRYLVRVARKIATKDNVAKTHQLDLIKLLADRLNLSESLFGKGFVLADERGFGGHEGEYSIIGSAQGFGSGLKPDELWVGLQRFFDIPHLSKQDFTRQAQSLSKMFGSANFTINWDTNAQPGHIPERTITIKLSSRDIKQIIISESDLPYYMELLSQHDIDANLQLIAEKTVYAEPKALVDLRAAKVQEFLTTQKDISGLRALTLLDSLSPTIIEGLPANQKLLLLESIANDPKAIDAVWNPRNTLFQISVNTPAYIKHNFDAFSHAKYTFISAAQKVETGLIDYLLNDPEAQFGPVLDVCLTIITSPIFVQNHQENTFDHIFSSYISSLVSSTLTADKKINTISNLLNIFPSSHHLWQALNISTKEQLQSLTGNSEFLAVTDEYQWPKNFKTRATNEQIKTKSELVCVVKLGSNVPDKNITDNTRHLNSLDITDKGGPVSVIRLERAFDTNKEEDLLLVDTILNEIEGLVELNDHAPLRLFVIGSSQKMNLSLGASLAFLDDNIQKRLTFSIYDMQKATYDDVSFSRLVRKNTNK